MVDVIVANPRIRAPGEEIYYLPYVSRSRALSMDGENTYSSAVHMMPLQQDGEQIIGGWHQPDLEMFFSPVTFRLRQQDTIRLYRPFVNGNDIQFQHVEQAFGMVVPLTATAQMRFGNQWKTTYAPEDQSFTPFYMLYKCDGKLMAKCMLAGEEGMSLGCYPAEQLFTNLEHILEKYEAFARPREPPKEHVRKPMSALRIKKELDAYVIGQEEAKIAAATVAASYLMGYPRPLLLVGPTGVGKTEIATRLAEILNVPYKECNLQGITTAGYVGGAIEEAILALAIQQKSERPEGVILFDELDKKVDPSDYVGGQGVQDALMPIIEGRTITPDLHQELRLLSPEAASQLPRTIDTSGLLCVCAGAFNRARGRPSLEEIAHDRAQHARGAQAGGRIGFGSTIGIDAPDETIKPQDLVEYGLKPELVGRFKNVVRLDDLTREQKLRILDSKKKNVLEEYALQLLTLGYDCTVDVAAKEHIVDAAHADLGARGLGEASERLFRHVLFDPEKYATDGCITITGELARELLVQSLGKSAS